MAHINANGSEIKVFFFCLFPALTAGQRTIFDRTSYQRVRKGNTEVVTSVTSVMD